MRLIISGGGTGGHIFPAIAIADALKEVDSSIEILFVGAEGKMEMERVPKAGYKIIGLPVVGFHRQKMWRNIGFPLKLLKSMAKARKVVKDFNPDGAIGVGGYASGPILKAANWAGVPTFLQEQNSYAGVTNKLLGKQATKIFTAYEGMDSFFAKDKIMTTGNPVRQEIAHSVMTKEDAKVRLGVEKASKVILVSGGSLGARAINEAILGLEEWISEHPEVHFYWQVGRLYLEEFQAKQIAALPNVKVVSFIEDMAAAYHAADLVICRAGALTLSELTLLGKASILMPSPNVAEDHQTHNAMALVKQDAALMVKDVEASEKLIGVLVSLLDNPSRIAEMEDNAKNMGKQDAAKLIARTIIEELKNNK